MSQPQPSTVSPRPTRKQESADLESDTVAHKRPRDHDALASSMSDTEEQLEAEDTEAIQKEDKPCYNRCWKCRLSGKKCNGGTGTVCDECISSLLTHFKKIRFCRRDGLADGLQGKIPNVQGLATNEWLLPAKPGLTFKIRMTYSNPELKIQDLKHFASWAEVDCKPAGAITKFLNQFTEIHVHWPHCYEQVTEEIIAISARFQAAILASIRSRPIPKSHLLIASVLRVLAMTHNIEELGSNMPYSGAFLLNDELDQPEDLPTLQDPSINVSKVDLTDLTTVTAPLHDGELSLMIQDIVQTTQRLIFLRRPDHWPAIFCTLCILHLIKANFAAIEFLNSFQGIDQLGTVWEELCYLFVICAGDHHPVSRNFNPHAYTNVVHDPKASDCFEELHQIWADGGFEEESKGHIFERRLRNFIMGDIW